MTSSFPYGFVTGDFPPQILPRRGRTPVLPRTTEISAAAHGLISFGVTESLELRQNSRLHYPVSYLLLRNYQILDAPREKSQPALPCQHMERFTGMSKVVGRQFTSVVFIALLYKGLKLTLKCFILYSSGVTVYSGFLPLHCTQHFSWSYFSCIGSTRKSQKY